MEEFNYSPSDSQFPAWVKNYAEKIRPLQTVVGLSNAELAKLEAIRDALVFCDDRLNTYEEARQDFVRTRQIILYGDETNELLESVKYEPQPAVTEAPAEVAPNAKPFILNLVKRTRICPGLNENQKKELGVLPKVKPETELVANIKGQLVNGQPVLECKLLGTNGFEIWRRVTGTSDFAYFDRSASTTYTDDSPLPEGLSAVQYDYQARLIGADNEPLTEFSNTVTLTKTA